MGARAVSPALADRLGPDATAGLVELIDTSERNCMNAVLTRSVERFERRLSEETSKIRIEMAQGHAALRQEIGALGSDLRQEINALGSDLRQEMGALGTGLRQEIASQRVDVLKWSFIFWIGQVVAITGIVGMLFRLDG